MAMKEILSVKLDARQIREACEIAVRDRVSSDYANDDFTANGITDGVTITVVVTKKRKPRAKKAAP